jgi:DNA polymerase-1
MLIQVHDELVFEVPKDTVASDSRLIKRLMEQAVPLSVPVVAEIGSGPNWAESK